MDARFLDELVKLLPISIYYRVNFHPWVKKRNLCQDTSVIRTFGISLPQVFRALSM